MLAAIVTHRLSLVALTDDALAREEAGLPPDLDGAATEGWPPEHWEPHVFAHIRSQYAAHPETRGWHRYIVLSASPACLIGTLGASPAGAGDVEFGYSILPAFQRRGFGTEAAIAFTSWLAAQPGICSLSAQTLPSLSGSIRVLEACGLTLTGVSSEAGTIRYRRVLNEVS